MPQLSVLICGAGIAGNALAFWLSKLGHDTTVIERYPGLRATGLQVDLRGPGIEVMRRMGLEKAFRARSVAEQGMELVDHKGRRWGSFPANRSGKGLQSFTTDFEIMRGDLCRLIYDNTKDRAKYKFGMYVQQITQTDDFAEVLFSDGSKERFDLVVGADGQGSYTRKMMLSPDMPDPFHSLGVCCGYFTMDQELPAGEEYTATMYMTTQSRGIMTRRHNPHKLQAYLFCKAESSKRFQNSSKGDVEEEKQALIEAFGGAGWQTERILKAMTVADDFYCERVGFVKIDHWSRDRIVVVGDAAYCPSVMTGMGTPCSIAGAYILAGEIGKYCGGGVVDAPVSKDNITTALKQYEQKFRPFMDQVQEGLTDSNYMDRFPSSSMGITIVYLLFAIVSFLRLDVLAKYVLREDTKGWELPEYQDMGRG